MEGSNEIDEVVIETILIPESDGAALMNGAEEAFAGAASIEQQLAFTIAPSSFAEWSHAQQSVTEGI